MLDPQFDTVVLYGSAVAHFHGLTFRRPRDVDYAGVAKDEASAQELRDLVQTWARRNGYPNTLDGHIEILDYRIDIGDKSIRLRFPAGMEAKVKAFSLYGNIPFIWTSVHSFSGLIRNFAASKPSDPYGLKDLLLHVLTGRGGVNFLHFRDFSPEISISGLFQGDLYRGSSPYALGNAIAQLDPGVWDATVSALNAELVSYGTFLDMFIHRRIPFRLLENPHEVFVGRNLDVWFSHDGFRLVDGSFLSFPKAIQLIWGKKEKVDTSPHYLLSEDYEDLMERIHKEALQAICFDPVLREFHGLE